jgi:hypothetical protein
MFPGDDELLSEENLAKLRLENSSAGGQESTHYLPLVPDQPRRVKGQFIRGPIPMAWIDKAVKSGGPFAVLIVLALCFQSGLQGSTESIKVTNKLAARFGISRKTKPKALQSLEEAGLIRVVRKPTSSPVVSIVGMENVYV